MQGRGLYCDARCIGDRCMVTPWSTLRLSRTGAMSTPSESAAVMMRESALLSASRLTTSGSMTWRSASIIAQPAELLECYRGASTMSKKSFAKGVLWLHWDARCVVTQVDVHPCRGTAMHAL